MKQDMQISLTLFGRVVSLLCQAAPRIDCDLFYLEANAEQFIYILKLFAHPRLSE